MTIEHSHPAKCKTILLEDSPSGVDEFSNNSRLGPHSRLAGAIVELIETEPKGKLVSIEGVWGSGKSTVVRLVRTLFQSKAETHLVTFDVWSHSGDPLRLMLLESLIRELSDIKWLSKAGDTGRWGRRLDVLSRAARETRTVTTPKPTRFGILMTLTLLLLPIGSELFSKGVGEGLTWDPSGQVAWFFVTGLSICLLPLFVISAALLNRRRVGNSERAKSS